MEKIGHSRTLKEIAAAVGFKTLSVVAKHIEKFVGAYEDYVSGEYGDFFRETHKIIFVQDGSQNFVAAFFMPERRIYANRAYKEIKDHSHLL